MKDILCGMILIGFGYVVGRDAEKRVVVKALNGIISELENYLEEHKDEVQEETVRD